MQVILGLVAFRLVLLFVCACLMSYLQHHSFSLFFFSFFCPIFHLSRSLSLFFNTQLALLSPLPIQSVDRYVGLLTTALACMHCSAAFAMLTNSESICSVPLLHGLHDHSVFRNIYSMEESGLRRFSDAFAAFFFASRKTNQYIVLKLCRKFEWCNASCVSVNRFCM